MSKSIRKVFPTGNQGKGQEIIQRHAAAAAITDAMPALDATPEEWEAYVQKGQLQAAQALVNWGRRLNLAHRAYDHQKGSWAESFDTWCRAVLGIDKGTLSRLETIALQLGSFSAEKLATLPGTQHSLYQLARLRRDDPQRFETVVVQLGPSSSRAEVMAALAQTSPETTNAPDVPRPTFTKWHSMTLATDALDRLTAAAEVQNRKPEDLAAELLEKAIARLV